MSLFMLFEILRTLERLLANLAIMRFQWYMDSKMAGDMVPFNCDNITITPVAAQAQVIGRFSANMVVGEMNIELFRIVVGLGAITPATLNVISHESGGMTLSRRVYIAEEVEFG